MSGETAFQRAGDRIGDAGCEMKKGCKDNANKAGDWMSEKYQNAKEGAVNKPQVTADWFGEKGQKAQEGFADRMQDAGQYIKDTGKEAKDDKGVTDYIADAGHNMKEAVVSGYEKTKDTVGGLFSSDEKK